MNAPLDRSRKPSLSRPNAFDMLRATSRISHAQWKTGDALRKLHAAGWIASGADVKTIRSTRARAARQRLSAIEAGFMADDWSLIRRAVLEGAQISELRSILPPATKPETADAIIVERLKLALDQAALFGVTNET